MPAGGRAHPESTPEQLEEGASEAPWAVFVHNDDVTPMDFVVHILVTVFQLPPSNAGQVMYAAHVNGKAYVQSLPVNEARRRVGQAHFAARLRGFPLEFTLEPE